MKQSIKLKIYHTQNQTLLPTKKKKKWNLEITNILDKHHVPNGNQNLLPINRLTRINSDRKNKGFCFNCNEKFGPACRCKKLFIIENCWLDEEENEYECDRG